jgi:hypothetical protein
MWTMSTTYCRCSLPARRECHSFYYATSCSGSTVVVADESVAVMACRNGIALGQFRAQTLDFGLEVATLILQVFALRFECSNSALQFAVVKLDFGFVFLQRLQPRHHSAHLFELARQVRIRRAQSNGVVVRKPRRRQARRSRSGRSVALADKFAHIVLAKRLVTHGERVDTAAVTVASVPTALKAAAICSRFNTAAVAHPVLKGTAVLALRRLENRIGLLVVTFPALVEASRVDVVACGIVVRAHAQHASRPRAVACSQPVLLAALPVVLALRPPTKSTCQWTPRNFLRPVLMHCRQDSMAKPVAGAVEARRLGASATAEPLLDYAVEHFGELDERALPDKAS